LNRTAPAHRHAPPGARHLGRGVWRDGGEADRAFIAAIDRQVLRSRTGEAVIYVPGYRVTFDQVMVLMGSWAHYLGARRRWWRSAGPPGRGGGALTDCPRARAFIPDIERLVALVAERSQARR
jgi:hypothetical protein